jgi:hypothetical protein
MKHRGQVSPKLNHEGITMKNLTLLSLLAASGFAALGATAASAEPWSAELPYAKRNHSVCQRKAEQLHDFERRAASDGRISPRERRTMNVLQADLDRTCGRFRRKD